MSQRSSKIDTDLRITSFEPDGRVYANFPTRDEQQFLSSEQTELLMDYLWLDGQANPDPGFGDYIPDGAAARYTRLHMQVQLPALWPVGVKEGVPDKGKARPVGKTVAQRFMNGRSGPSVYKRMALDEKFKDKVGTKAARFVNWQPAGSDLLA
eukprot:5696690-Prymnesium_polylepis.1